MRIVIVEDEPAIADRIERLTGEILGSKISLIKRFLDVDSAIEYLVETPIDLLLLDLHITGQSGFEVLKHTASSAYQVIIISAFAEHAITAFEWGVLDFVNKPFSRDRLQAALSRFVDTESRAKITAKYLSVKRGQELEILEIDAIEYIIASDNYSELVLSSGEKRLHDKSLGKLLMVLPPVFVRTHKSYIVRMNKVVKMHTHRGGKYEVELESGVLLPIGRSRYKDIQELFI